MGHKGGLFREKPWCMVYDAWLAGLGVPNSQLMEQKISIFCVHVPEK